MDVQYKNFDELPITFGPEKLCEILGISRTYAYKIVSLQGFPKIRIGKKIVISKKLFIQWFEDAMTNGVLN